MKKIIVFVLVLVLVSAALPSTAFGAEDYFELTADEKAYLQSISGTPITLAATSELNSFITADGTRSGVLQPLIAILEDDWGLTVNIVNIGWEESFNQLDKGGVDLLGLAVLNNKRSGLYRHTEKLYDSGLDIYTLGDYPLTSVVELEGKTIGLLSDSALYGMVDVYLTSSGGIKYYKTVDGLAEALEAGEIDCIATSLSIQSELLPYQEISYKMTVENIVTPQCLYSGNEKLYPLIDIINRYLGTPLGVELTDRIKQSYCGSLLEKYREFYSGDIGYVQKNYDKIYIYDSGTLYPLSFVANGEYDGLQAQVNGIFSDITGVPVEVLGPDSFPDGLSSVIGELKTGGISAAAGIYRPGSANMAPGIICSSALFIDRLSFYVRHDNEIESLRDMEIGTIAFGSSYLNWSSLTSHEPIVFGARRDMVESLKSGELDAIFIGEMTTDYYYTVLNDYALKRFDNTSIPASVHMLLNSDNESLNRLLNLSIELQAVMDQANRSVWTNASQNSKFEFMWLRDQYNKSQSSTLMAITMLLVTLTFLLLFVIYQLRKFSNYDKQISKMLSVQGNADMIWGDLVTGKIISKGDFPIFKKVGVAYDDYQEHIDIESFKDDIRKINSLSLPFYQKDIEIRLPDSDSFVYIRRFTHKINDDTFMAYLLDITAEKYREAELGMLADTDHLTALLNRRAIDRNLSEKSASLVVNPKRIYVFMFDIDNFKNVNDSYGHDIGDITLVAAASCVKSVFGDGNSGRWGGEEFFAVAELDSEDEAVKIAESVLLSVSEQEIKVGTRTSFYVTISCGASEMLADETYMDAVARADKALYQAKNDGKNCVRFIERGSSADIAITHYRSNGNAPVQDGSDISPRYNRIMSQLVRAIFYGRNTDAIIYELLKIAALYNNLCRAYFYENLDGECLSLTHIYDPTDSAKNAGAPVNIPMPEEGRRDFSDFLAPIFVSDTSKATTTDERALLTPDIKAYARLPVVMNNNEFIGLICLDKCNGTHEWASDERLILTDLAVILGETVSRRKLEHRLNISNSSLISILDSIDDYVYVVEYKTRKLLFSNKKMRDDYQLELGCEGKTCWEVLRPDIGGVCPFCPHNKLAHETGGLIAGGSLRAELYNDFAKAWVDMTCTVIDWDNGGRAILMFCRDITAQKLFDERQQLLLDDLQLQELKTTLALEGANSFSWESMPDIDALILSRPAELALGYPLSYTEGRLSKYMELIPPEYSVDLLGRQLGYINGGLDMYMSEYPLITSSGEIKWYLSKGRCAHGRRDVIYGVCVDITESKRYEQRLSELAYKDALTGLYNMQYISDGHVKPTEDNFENFGAILLDIRSFKNINEAFGFDYGNRILADIANRLAGMFDGRRIIRPSGDRFFIIFENAAVSELEARASELLDAFSKPVLTDGQLIGIHLKIGISINRGTDVIKLLKDAEIALNDTKNGSGKDYCVLNDSIRAAFTQKVNMELELRKAIEQRNSVENEFVMYYQPKISVIGKKLIGAEALIRWMHPESGIISPADFIPIAEETGLIIPIGEFVIREVTRQLREWLDKGYDIFLSLNLSFKQFLSPHLKKNILDSVNRYNIPSKRLVVEFTESTMISDISYIKKFVSDLRQVGIGISLDDFGTGYSSISYLSQMPLNYLKIDKSFTTNATSNDADKTLLETIITMSHNLDFHVTAEGVETEAQLSMLEDMGCDLIQGFLYSKPLPADELEKFMQSSDK